MCPEVPRALACPLSRDEGLWLADRESALRSQRKSAASLPGYARGEYSGRTGSPKIITARKLTDQSRQYVIPMRGGAAL